MMDSGNGSKEMPSGNLCRNGCGFYGSAATEGMCSKCFKDTQRKKQNSPVQSSLASSATTPTSITSNNISTSATPPSIPGLPTASACTTTTSFSAASSSSDDKSEDGATAASGKEASPSPASTGSPNGSDEEKGKKKRNRCHTCRKKVGLTGFECRCGGLYCSIHRYSDKHECSFDYRSHGKEEIRKNNPVVVGEKIKKL